MVKAAVDHSAIAHRFSSIHGAEGRIGRQTERMPKNMGRVLVTGGAGNVGSHLSLALRRSGYQVLAFDNLINGHREPLDMLRIPLVQGDLEDFDAIHDTLKAFRPDVVLHAAALIEVGESQKKPGQYINGNVVGTLNLLEAMSLSGIGRLLFSNTAAVYDGSLGRPLKETDPKLPSSVYGATKNAVGRILEGGNLFPDIKTISLHYFNVCGADKSGVLREDHGIPTESHLIPRLMQIAIYNLIQNHGLKVNGQNFNETSVAGLYREGGRTAFTVFGNDFETPDGTCIRDYLGMEMMTFYHMLAIAKLFGDANLPGYSAYNLGTKTGNSVLDILQKTERVIKSQPGFEGLRNLDESVIPFSSGDRREGDSAFLVADPGKAEAELKGKKKVRFPNVESLIANAFWSILYRPLGYKAGPVTSIK